MLTSTFRTLGGTALMLSLASGAQAATFYSAGDDVTTAAAMVNSRAASDAFDALVPGTTRIDFESALPAGFSTSGGSIVSSTPVAGCQHRCGFNVTTGGANYLHWPSGGVTFTFAGGINRFGAYLTGLQNTLVGGPVVMSFNDGTAQSVALPGVEGGGGAFIGFTTTGVVTSVSFSTRSDIVGFDDIRYALVQGNAGVPEPASWALMIGGFGIAGAAARRRRTGVACA